MSELTHKERKERPVLTGVLDYFPDAILEVAYCSHVCNEQHNKGENMHWAKDKSIGEGNEIVRHLMDRKKHTRDTDGVRVLAKAAWRALELLQREIEAERATRPIVSAKITETGHILISGPGVICGCSACETKRLGVVRDGSGC